VSRVITAEWGIPIYQACVLVPFSWKYSKVAENSDVKMDDFEGQNPQHQDPILLIIVLKWCVM
jgi:hypothetical protein